MIPEVWRSGGVTIIDPPAIPPAEATAELVIESIDGGLIKGWARAIGRIAPVQIEIWLGGIRAGFAEASRFRSDLFAAGLSHAHYGFSCRLKPGTPLRGEMELRDAGSNQVLASRSLMFGNAVAAAAVQPIETVLTGLQTWATGDFDRGFGVLELERNRSLLGDRLFAGHLRRFILGRWPDAQELQRDRSDLERSSSNDLARRLAATAAGRSCPSPYDRAFPFKITPYDPVRREPAQRLGPVKRLHASDYLASARLVSAPWDSPHEQFSHDAQQGMLLCHPPPRGITLLRLQQFAERGPLQVQLRASIGNAQSHAVEFALVLAGEDTQDHDVLAQLTQSRHEWQRIGWGSSRNLQVQFDRIDQPAKLYLATRMAPDAANNYFAWAHFSNLRWDRQPLRPAMLHS